MKSTFSNINTFKKCLTCSLKIISLATIIIPLFAGASYFICLGIERIKGRVKVIQPNDNSTDTINTLRKRTFTNINIVRHQTHSDVTTRNRQTLTNTDSVRHPTLSEAELKKMFFAEVESGNFSKVNTLLRQNNNLAKCSDHNGMNALFHAKSPEMLKLLLQNGANPNKRADYGCKRKTPLIYHCDKPEFIKLLLTYGADRDAQEVGGWTALNWARRNHNCNGDRNIRDYRNNNHGEDCHKNIWNLKYFNL